MTILPSRSIYYKDCNLVAQPTSISSRSEIKKELERIVVSPMASIVGDVFAKKAIDLGLSVCLHRFDKSVESRIKLVNEIKEGRDRLWVSIGMKNLEDAVRLTEAGATSLVIDVANGYMSSLVDYAYEVAVKARPKRLMLGNIHSSSILPHYLLISESMRIPIYYRCGIASGSACNTKGMTGYNRGQITEIEECAEFSSHFNNLILVADGGISNPAYAVKAFGAGAEMVMMGGYFSKAKESAHVVDEIYKFWGGASQLQQILTNGEATRHSEGKELDIDQNSLQPLETLVNDLWGGIASGVSYSGYTSLSEFIGKGIFELVN